MKNLGAINLLFIRLQKLATITRSNEWWASKGSPVLATAYATASILNIPLVSLWNSLIFLLISLTVVAIYAHLLNDISDQDEDLIVGKSNGLAGRSKSFKGIAIILCLFPGLLVIGCLIKLPLALAIYISNWLIFICYSIPPIRLKQRRLIGRTIFFGKINMPTIRWRPRRRPRSTSYSLPSYYSWRSKGS